MLNLVIQAPSLLACALVAVIGAAPRARAQSIASRVDAVFAAYDKPTSPGCAISISDSGRTVFEKGYGMASLEHDVPITPTTPFYAASVSKQFTAFAIALLAKDGKLTLDDDIRKWIPEVPNFGKTITIKHLLHHTSGIRDYFGLLGMTDWPSDGPLTEAQFLDLVHRQRALNFPPGERFLYSNTGYVLLSLVVKRASGQSLREFADARIFGPLGMTNTHFRDDHTALVKHRALAYTPRNVGGTTEWRLDTPGFDVIGDGGLYTTVDDLAKWARNGDDHRVGGDDIASLVLTRGRLNSGDSIPYAFGLTLGMVGNTPTIEHSGSYGGYRTEVLRFPTQRVAVLTLCNAANANPSAMSMRVAATYLGDRLSPSASAATQAGAPMLEPAIAISAEQAARYAGSYWNDRDQALLKLQVRNGELALGANPLIPIGVDRFRNAPGTATYTFKRDASGSMGLEIAGRTPGDVRLLRKTNPPSRDEKMLKAFAGEYASDELDTRWGIVVANGGLVIRRRATPDLPLEPAFDDSFISRFGLLEFTHDRNGRVTGFTVGGGRTTGVEFRRMP